jgi:hypothetical protein
MRASLLFTLCLIIGCAIHVINEGGNESFSLQKMTKLDSEERLLYAQSVVSRLRRDPPLIRLKDFLEGYDDQLKKIGILVFETQLQATRSGLTNDRNVFLSEKGKQKLTIEFFHYWLNQLKLELPEKTFVGLKEIKKTESFSTSGSPQEDYVLKSRKDLNSNELFYLPSGKKVTPITTLNVPGMRDLSSLLVPATEFLATAKFSEHQKHWINDVSKELELDAVIVVRIDVDWTRGGVDKRTKEKINEEMKFNIESALLVPWNRYHKVGHRIKPKEDFPKVTISLGHYVVKANLPVVISVDEKEETFETVSKNILLPLKQGVENISQLLILKMASDLRQI